jgi:hypothetical protein
MPFNLFIETASEQDNTVTVCLGDERVRKFRNDVVGILESASMRVLAQEIRDQRSVDRDLTEKDFNKLFRMFFGVDGKY